VLAPVTPNSPLIGTAVSRCEEALLQNNVTNIFVDDLSLLADDEGAGATGRQDGARPTEAQSFTDLIYSKNKVST
jgi:hypothetical protein